MRGDSSVSFRLIQPLNSIFGVRRINTLVLRWGASAVDSLLPMGSLPDTDILQPDGITA